MFTNDKLTRVRSSWDPYCRNCFSHTSLVSVDEWMVASKHYYSGIRQCVRDKQMRFGLKLSVLPNSITGYTNAFLVYIDRERTELNNRIKGLAYNLVMELNNKLANQGCITCQHGIKILYGFFLHHIEFVSMSLTDKNIS